MTRASFKAACIDNCSSNQEETHFAEAFQSMQIDSSGKISYSFIKELIKFVAQKLKLNEYILSNEIYHRLQANKHELISNQYILNKYNSEMSLDLTPSEAELYLYERLNSHVQMNQIQLSTFWNTKRLCLTLEQFLLLLPSINFHISPKQQRALQDENVQFVNLSALIDGVEYWKNQEVNVATFLTKQDESIEKNQPKDQKSTGKDQNKNKFELRLQTATSRASKTAKSRAISKQLQAEVKLSNTLIKAKNESDYQLTIKVGQINDICKKLKNNLSFLINASQGDTKIIEIDSKTGKEEIIKPKIFEKKYVELKTASLQKGQQFEGTLQQDLKKTLVQVMCLSDQLEQQIRLLQAKGVSH